MSPPKCVIFVCLVAISVCKEECHIGNTGECATRGKAMMQISQSFGTFTADSKDVHRNVLQSTDPFEPVPDVKVAEAVTVGVSFMSSSPGEAMMDPAVLVQAGRGNDKFDIYMSDERVHDALSSVQCKGAKHNRTCAIKNLYFSMNAGGFVVCTLAGTQLPDFESVLFLHKWAGRNLQRKTFATLMEFRKFLMEAKPTEHKGLSLVYDSIWHSNIGHAIWDGLYPAFVALLEWDRHTEKFRSVIGMDLNCNQPGTADGKCMGEGVFRKFGGGELLPYATLNGWHRFTDSISGSGRKGQRSINANYALPAGHSHNAAWHFRNRMYTSHGLPIPKIRARSSEGRESEVMKGILIANKRFLPDEDALLRNIAENSQNHSQQVQLTYVDYSASEYGLNFTRHLELIGQTSLHVSSVGTSQCYTPFLPDGSVHVNLGNRHDPFLALEGVAQKYHDRQFASYVEEVWAEGVPYIRALYYDPFQRAPHKLESNAIHAIIQLAQKTIMDGFTIPVLPGLNLSPVGKVFKKYCETSLTDCNALISQMNGDGSVGFANITDVWHCNQYAWAELFVFEIGGWSETGQREPGDDVVRRCPINRQILRKLRQEEFGW